MAKPFFRNFIKRIQDAADVDYEAEAVFLKPIGDLDIETDCEKYEQLQQPHNNVDEFEENEIFDDDFNR